MFIYLILGIIIIAIVYTLSFYNSQKTILVRIGASIQEIGNQLKRQADLIPNLVDSVKGYMKHEKDVFALLTDARKKIETAVKSGQATEIDQAQTALTSALRSLQVVVESNPQIQAAGLVGNMMQELRDTADKVMYARRTLIDLTADYNTAIETIPGVWLASLFGFNHQAGLSTPTDGQFLNVSSADTQTPKVKLD